MGYKIVWTSHAIKDYNELIHHLQNKWGESIAANVQANIERRLNHISTQPFIGIRSEKLPFIRSILLSSKNRLYYRFYNNIIEIINIIDTRQNPKTNLF